MDIQKLRARVAAAKQKASDLRENAVSPLDPSSEIERLRQRVKSPAALDQDLIRVLMMEISDMPERLAEMKEEFDARYVRPEWRAKGFGFFPQQVHMVEAYREVRGELAFMGVGQGKTFASLMMGEVAFRELGHERILLLVPSDVVPQLKNRDIPDARRRFFFTSPVHILHGLSGAARMNAVRGAKGIFVLTYQLLSRPGAEELLDALAPTLIVADEAHSLKNKSSSRTKRFQHFVDHACPEVVYMSGTLTTKKLEDFWHLSTAALQDRSPIPLHYPRMKSWASVLDAQSNFTRESMKSILPLIEWAQAHTEDSTRPYKRDIESARRAFRRRMHTCPGVVMSSNDHLDIGVSLTLHHEKPLPIPKAVADLVHQVQDRWQDPMGEPIAWAMHKFRWMHEFSAGFYYELRWPTEKEVKGPDAAERIEQAKEEHQINGLYQTELREFLKRFRSGLNSPFEVGSAIQQGKTDGLPEALVHWFRERRQARDYAKERWGGLLERKSTPIRVDSFRVDAAIRWAEEHKKTGAILWYRHQEIGLWLVELAEAAGLDVLYCPAGQRANEEIIDTSNGSKICVASYEAHNKAKNLQHWHKSYYVQQPREADKMEQSLGRTHRNGQFEDVSAFFQPSLPWDHQLLGATLNDAIYAQDMSGAQKLLYGVWTSPPKIFESSELVQAGIEHQKLSAEQRNHLRELFAFASE